MIHQIHGLTNRVLLRHPAVFVQVRTATKKASGSSNNHGGSPGQRLGIKKFSDEFCIPGNVIVRQRGTQFHPGQHVKMGRDHTIFATSPGFVRFYTEKWMRSTRRFVGLVLDRGEKLPRDEDASGRSRHFGLIDLNDYKRQQDLQKASEAGQRRLGI